MNAVGVLALVAAVGYAGVNAFGAWAVVRRRSRVAAAFLVAAALLMVGAVALGFDEPSATAFVAAGAALASFASWWNARSVLRRLVPRRHLARAIAGVALVLLTLWAGRL